MNCPNCKSKNYTTDGHCKDCGYVVKLDICVRQKAGRCANGAELGSGVLWHAIPKSGESWGRIDKALCGARPGKRTPGWSSYHASTVITCPKCSWQFYKYPQEDEMNKDKFEKIDSALEREKRSLDKKYFNGEISTDEYNQQVCELERDAREEYNSPDFPDDRMY
jgi:hypothetical protein